MSLKDDFLEALRSVKKDFFKEYEPSPETAAHSVAPVQAAFGEEPKLSAVPSYTQKTPPGPAVEASGGERMSDDEIGALIRGEEAPLEASNPELHTPAEALFTDSPSMEDEEDIAPDVDPTPYRTVSGEDAIGSGALSPAGSDGFGGGFPPDDGRVIFDDFDRNLEGDERTIISKNTVIRGTLQTEDSIRMFGQVLGDIDCRSNILVAGKVRGNTSAANAYIINAQVDGNLLCDDVVNVTDDAWILGNIRAQQAEIDGKIKGNIEIRHMISVGSHSSIIGNISADELEIKRGAFVNGQVMMYSPSRDVIDRFERFDQ